MASDPRSDHSELREKMAKFGALFFPGVRESLRFQHQRPRHIGFEPSTGRGAGTIHHLVYLFHYYPAPNPRHSCAEMDELVLHCDWL